VGGWEVLSSTLNRIRLEDALVTLIFAFIGTAKALHPFMTNLTVSFFKLVVPDKRIKKN